MGSFQGLVLMQLQTIMSLSMCSTNWMRISWLLGKLWKASKQYVFSFSFYFFLNLLVFMECFWDRSGIQLRRDSWQAGVLGTNCPIPPKWNWTYDFQVKDQIGSFFYFPSLNLQRAAGGFGSFVITNRPIIAIPFAQPDGDIEIFIGDWYIRNHTVSILLLTLIFSCEE